MSTTEDFMEKHCRQFFTEVMRRMIKKHPDDELAYLRAIEEAVNTKVEVNK